MPKLLIAQRREHSRIPEEAYKRIDRLRPDRHVELFARSSRPWWQNFENQPGLVRPRAVLTRRGPSWAV